jgi:16S rRNA (cytosine1402-N4)-methyltransferase
MTLFSHTPVLLEAVLDWMAPVPGRVYVDATLGGGGHAKGLLERLQPTPTDTTTRLIGMDQDPAALAHAKEVLAPYASHVAWVHANFSTLPVCLSELGIPAVTGGVLADLGVSSHQLDTGERGFSFRADAPLDMRMDPATTLTAEGVVNTYSEQALSHIFGTYGEARFSKTIARAIVQQRTQQPLRSTGELATLVAGVYRRHGGGDGGRIHPATQVFQALRIEVNDELGHLERFLKTLPSLLAPGARILIISFHSLEDRIVKRFFQQESRECVCPPRLPVCQCSHRATLKVLTGKPVVASPDEVKENPRSRSAKLRVAERLGE